MSRRLDGGEQGAEVPAWPALERELSRRLDGGEQGAEVPAWPALSFSGALIQNAIYIAQEPPEWPITADDWERAAEERLDAGAFGYIAGGAGAESTMRANLDAFAKWRIRPRMLTGNTVRDISVDVLGTHSPGPFLLAPVGVLSIAHETAEVGGRRGLLVVGSSDGALERGYSLDRRGRSDERAPLVPALLGERP